ncbi:MAG: hypothetical protein COV67_07455 [Nitrospinae bacterium CG11_big_fil_rev_8_21_14_0_20_56_8]|nr:MAG: hypothetical protein COV67_07455 [Nitrospinae bacterium CG11_big_fil_rev_8_21_14_0_20_56_8]
MGTTVGLILYDTTTPENYLVFDNRKGLLSNGIFAVKLDNKGRPWVGTYGGGLSYHDESRWVNLNTPQGLCDAFVYDIEFAGDSIWIATWSGANRLRGDPFSRSSWERFTVENTHGGLIDDWVYAIEVGKDGRIWFGTESGISLFDGTAWRNWNHRNGLGAPYETVKDDNADGVSYFEGNHHERHSHALPNIEDQTFRPNYVVSMLLDRANRLWIGTWGGGLALLDTQNFTFRNFTRKDGLPENFVLSLAEGPGGNLWIGTSGGLARFDGETFTRFSKMNGLLGDFIFSLEFGPDHSLWVGGHYGMNRLILDPQTGNPMTAGLSGTGKSQP